MPFDIVVHITEDTPRGRMIQQLAAEMRATPAQVIDRIIDEVVKTHAKADLVETPTMALMRKWLEEDATSDPAEQRAAEKELTEFKRNMNRPRKEAGARLLYPEAE
jgi:hypothetical protein